MAELSWLSQEAKNIHDIFNTLYFSMAGLILVIGVLIEYFKLPLSGSANFSQLLVRLIIATLFLVAYPDITNFIADISDGLAEKIGGINSLDNIVDSSLDVLKKKSWGWTSMGDSLLWVLAYIVYFVLYLTVFVFEAIILYGWTMLYIFSPVLILMYILPQTSGATALLFKSHIELASYKVVWSVLGALLWSTALQNLNDEAANKPNFFVVLGFMVIVAFSIIFTPKVVGALTKTGIGGLSSQLGAISFGALTAGMLGPKGLSMLMKGAVGFPLKTGFEVTKFGFNKAKGMANQIPTNRRRSYKDLPKNVTNLQQYKKNKVKKNDSDKNDK